ncbi:MAG: hypothetical protein GF344_00515 [Chitinivibrionales bacterium]|nr:hypothetical protein [Chitinivibrionales bacterium]MBD3355610.1 hypothetical protein [Chitinivibrionales bacterium]
MKWARAFGSGLLGGAVMTAITAIARGMGMPVNLAMMLGTIFGLAPSGAAWFLGFIVHLVVSGLLGILYGIGFEYVTHRANAGIGAAFSVAHILIAGLFLGAMPAIHPLIPGMLNSPGIFLSNLGFAGVAVFVILHLIYGLIVGSAYGAVRHKPAQRSEAAPAG